MIQKTNLIFIIPFFFFFSCKFNTNKTKPLTKDFVFVKGATIEGAIQAEGYKESTGFVGGKKVTIADFYM